MFVRCHIRTKLKAGWAENSGANWKVPDCSSDGNPTQSWPRGCLSTGCPLGLREVPEKFRLKWDSVWVCVCAGVWMCYKFFFASWSVEVEHTPVYRCVCIWMSVYSPTSTVVCVCACVCIVSQWWAHSQCVAPNRLGCQRSQAGPVSESFSGSSSSSRSGAQYELHGWCGSLNGTGARSFH